MTDLTHLIWTAKQIADSPLAVIAPPNPQNEELVLVKSTKAGEPPYWGLLLEPLDLENDGVDQIWTVKRLSDQELSDSMKRQILENEPTLDFDEMCKKCGVDPDAMFASDQ
ncbi:MAG: hypothetical protein F4Z16_06630 [Rhodothermaceae bacterium]|nr:hypothetical protein [Rhodothermaceae bacterium]MYD66840.1 hypothetical protein [Rhodothermaceae bacterium]MYI78162.1 hypothetical protein [Gammaproteobacteria bacterium]